MIVRTADYLSEAYSELSSDYYLRRLPGRPGYSVRCRKPYFSKEKKEEYRNSLWSVIFKEATLRAKADYADSEKREMWAKRYKAVIDDYRRKRKSLIDSTGRRRVPAYLWLFIRSEIMKEMKREAEDRGHIS